MCPFKSKELITIDQILKGRIKYVKIIQRKLGICDGLDQIFSFTQQIHKTEQGILTVLSNDMQNQ